MPARVTDAQARACETATGKVCRCRGCGGLLHGVAAEATPPDLPGRGSHDGRNDDDD
jgi:hypothetical protein